MVEEVNGKGIASHTEQYRVLQNGVIGTGSIEREILRNFIYISLIYTLTDEVYKDIIYLTEE